MVALSESVEVESLSLAGLPLPATIRLTKPMSDDELIAFSRRNRPYRIEQNAEGELEIMSPVGYDGGEREQYVAGERYVWAKNTEATHLVPIPASLWLTRPSAAQTGPGFQKIR